MSIFPEMTEGDPNELPDFRNMTYSSSEEFSAAFHAGFSELKERGLITDPTRQRIDSIPKPMRILYPGLEPASKTQIEEHVKDRPGLEIPDGTSLDIVEAMTQRYDDDKYFNHIYEHPASFMGKIAAFGGSTAAGILDIKSDLMGFGAGKIVQQGFKPLANQFMQKMAVKEIVGSKAAQIGTTIAAHSAEASAGFGGYQLGVEAQTNQEKTLLNQPVDYIQSLQNIGKASGFGAIFGGVLGVGSIGLFGLKVPGEATRSGGILNSRAFENVSEKTKDVIGRYFLPWSKDSDITMKEESFGQMLNGQAPDVSLVMRQGQIDEGANFRNILREHNIEPAELSAQLEDANGKIYSQLKEISTIRKSLKESDKRLVEDEGRSIKENKEMSQAGLLKRFEQAQFESSFLENVPKIIPENLQKHIDLQMRINELKNKIKDQQINKQTQRRIKQLEAKRPKVLSPKQELKSIKNKLMTSDGLLDDFENTNAYQRLVDLSKVWSAARNLLDRVHLERDHQLMVGDLLSQGDLVNALKNHVDDAHEPVTRDDMKAYSDHLKSVGLPKSEYVLPDSRELSFDDHLQRFESDEVNQLLDRPELEELKKEFDEGQKRIENQPKFAQMVKEMVNCIIKGVI